MVERGTYVASKAAKQKYRMNHGQLILVLLFFNIAAVMASGTIQSARGSLTVVPTARAVGPYLALAPTTELVSWMASAAQRPNWVSVKCTRWPMRGKSSSATELSTNTVPSETLISSSFASSTGPIAAIALPPQMAVPMLINCDCVLPTLSRYPSRMPRPMTKLMLIAVYTKPDLPAWSTCPRFIPKPRQTTAACNRNRERCRVSLWKRWTVVSPKTSPTASASGGPIRPEAATIMQV